MSQCDVLAEALKNIEAGCTSALVMSPAPDEYEGASPESVKALNNFNECLVLLRDYARSALAAYDAKETPE